MNSIIRNLTIYLDNHNVRYTAVDENRIHLKYGMEKFSGSTLNIVIALNTKTNAISLQAFGLGSVQSITFNILKTINKLNYTYKWFKLFVDGDNDIIVNTDFFVNEDNSNELISKYISLTVSMAEEYFPVIQKCIWGDNN